MTKMICLGDSIMQGWDGHKTVATPIPQMIGQINGWQVDNKAIGGTSINKGDNSMVDLLPSVDLSAYDYVLIGYGTNDWGLEQESLTEMQEGLDKLAAAYQKNNSHATVLIELPIESFLHGNLGLDGHNRMGISQNDVCNLLIKFAQQQGFNYYDWRTNPLVTADNRYQVLGDGCLHPNFDMMKKMAKVLADALINQNAAPKKLILEKLDKTQFAENVSTNAYIILGFIKGLYSQLPPFFQKVPFNAEPEYSCPGDSSDRLRRQYMIKELLSLGLAINQLISVCNKYHVVNPEGFKPTSMISMDPPRGLTFDDVKDGLNREYQKIENKLNEMSEYIANFAS